MNTEKRCLNMRTVSNSLRSIEFLRSCKLFLRRV